MKIPLLGGTGGDHDSSASQQLTQNWYVSKDDSSKSSLILYPTPGLTLFSNIGAGPIRGSIEFNDLLYVVSGSELYEINSIGTGILIATLNTSIGQVSMTHNGPANGRQIAIADGADFYIWQDDTSDFKVITDAADPDYDADCPKPTVVVFMDGYFIVNDPSVTGKFAISSSYDGRLWDATEFATAERSPDGIQSIVVANRQLWLVGIHTAEQWFNSGALDFPFEPVQSGFSQWGTGAPNSLIEVAGLTFWLSKNDEGEGIVLMTSGSAPQAISTSDIATEISKFDSSDCYTYSYQYQQHAFVVFTFKKGMKTLVYDISMQEWHQWKTETTGFHRSSSKTFVFNKHLVGDPLNGKIYKLDWDSRTDNGEVIKRIRRSKNIHGDDRTITHEGVWLDIKEGVGDAVTIDPQINLRWRDNNGSWSNYHQRSMGKAGDTGKKVVWRHLGRSRDRVYEISVTDPINAVITDSYAKIKADKRELG